MALELPTWAVRNEVCSERQVAIIVRWTTGLSAFFVPPLPSFCVLPNRLWQYSPVVAQPWRAHSGRFANFDERFGAATMYLGAAPWRASGERPQRARRPSMSEPVVPNTHGSVTRVIKRPIVAIVRFHLSSSSRSSIIGLIQGGSSAKPRYRRFPIIPMWPPRTKRQRHHQPGDGRKTICLSPRPSGQLTAARVHSRRRRR